MVFRADVEAFAAAEKSPAVARALGRRLMRLLLWPVHVVVSRREFAKVAALSDRELCDIGLTRQDLRDATALPLDADPTRLLDQRAWRRRRGV